MKTKLAIKKGNTVYTGRDYTSIIMRYEAVNLRGGIFGTVDKDGNFLKADNKSTKHQ